MTGNCKKILSVAALAGLASIAAQPVLADADQAIAGAAQHAGLAGNQGELAGVHLHLRHSLNCLVGAEGEGFDQSAGNPCAAAGGAIPQTAAGEMRDKLEAVADQVREGIASSDLDAAKEVAMSVQEMLTSG